MLTGEDEKSSWFLPRIFYRSCLLQPIIEDYPVIYMVPCRASKKPSLPPSASSEEYIAWHLEHNLELHEAINSPVQPPISNSFKVAVFFIVICQNTIELTFRYFLAKRPKCTAGETVSGPIKIMRRCRIWLFLWISLKYRALSISAVSWKFTRSLPFLHVVWLLSTWTLF